MPVLTRTVRFAINPAAPSTPPSAPTAPSPAARDPNGYAGSPSMRGLGRHYELHIGCEGEADPATGYLVDIKDVDAAVRSAVIPLIDEACRRRPETDPAALLPDLLGALRRALPPAQRLRWSLSPYYSVEMTTREPGVALLRQKFDFAASHRLHVPSLSDEENRRLFGKCNSPAGHGHNYQFEPCIAQPIDASGRAALSLQDLERLAESTIIRRFDHKYLNEDAAEFRVGEGGVNPTVENIARVCFDLLAAALAREAPSATLRSVTVWETDRTSCTYPA